MSFDESDLYARGLQLITSMEGGGTTWREPLERRTELLRRWTQDRLVCGAVLGAAFDTACQSFLQGFAN
jgi:hypothetical protein